MSAPSLARFEINLHRTVAGLLARDTFVRTNHRAIAVMFVCLSVWDWD